MIQYALPISTMVLGAIQSANAKNANEKLTQDMQKQFDMDRIVQEGLISRMRGEARGLKRAGTSLTSELMKEGAKESASDAIDAASRSGADIETVKSSVATGIKKASDVNVEAAKFDDLRRREGDKMLEKANLSQLGVESNFSNRIYELMSKQVQGNVALGQAGISNTFGGASDLVSTALATKLGYFDRVSVPG